MHHPTDRITHTTAFVTPVVEHWLEREIAQWVHPMKDRSDDPPHHELPLSYVPLLSYSRFMSLILNIVPGSIFSADESNGAVANKLHSSQPSSGILAVLL